MEETYYLRLSLTNTDCSS